MRADRQAAVGLGRGAGAPGAGVQRALEARAALAGAEVETGAGGRGGIGRRRANVSLGRRRVRGGRYDRRGRRRANRRTRPTARIGAGKDLGPVTESIAVGIELPRVGSGPVFLGPAAQPIPIRIDQSRDRSRGPGCLRSVCHRYGLSGLEAVMSRTGLGRGDRRHNEQGDRTEGDQQ